MHIDRPDPRFFSAERNKKNFNLAIKLAAAVLAAVWVVFFLDTVVPFSLKQFGLQPRSVQGLTGLISVPLLHGDLSHIAANTIPLFVGLIALLYLYPNSALRVLPAAWLGSGLLAWVFARPVLHIGASGLVYALLTFIFFSGVFRRDLRSITVSMLVWFIYGSMIWGVLPIRQGMSWELHLSGAISGLVLAWIFRRWDRIPVKRYDWELDDSVPDWYIEPSEGDENKP